VTQSTHARIGSKQTWGNLIDHDVCALGAQYRCREQLPWVFELQSRASVGIGSLECGHHLPNVLLPCECHLHVSSPYCLMNKPTRTRNRCLTSESPRNRMKLPAPGFPRNDVGLVLFLGEDRTRSYGEQGVSYERVTLAPCRVLWVSCITGRKKFVNSRSD